jgi:hypothetical protein
MAGLHGLARGLASTTERRPRWRRRRRPVTWLGWTLGAALLGLAAISILTVVSSLVLHTPFLGITMGGVRQRCDATGFACTVASSIFFTIGPLLVGSLLFVVLRLRVVRRPLVKEARERPAELVDTAGQIHGRVVGREDICNVLQEDLRDRDGRRPHVIVGGVGVGKTAVLVRLTELLAKRGAVPVPIRLRDASKDIDLLEMARTAFLRGTQSSQWLAAEAERAWNLLRRDDKVVVLADGLEEALADLPDPDRERDHRVRVAVAQARKQGYPLVIASRAHDALSGLDAALFRLEPLSHEAAIEHIRGARGMADEHRLGRIIATANVVEAPLYLELARELHESGQLRHEVLDTRSADRMELRRNLIAGWVKALIAGDLERTARVPLTPTQREATVVQLAALACCGLAQDTVQVTFDMFEKASGKPGGSRKPVYAALCKAARDRVNELSTEDRPLRLDVQVAASNGVRLGLVEPKTNGIRFPHSIMQAYLGSMLIGGALKDDAGDGPSFAERAFTAPGREFLVALIMFSRSPAAEDKHPGSGKPWRCWLAQELCRHATAASDDVKALELLAAAVEVDSVEKESSHRQPACSLVTRWLGVSARDDATRDAKAIAIARLGDAAHRVADAELKRRRSAPSVHLTAPQNGHSPASGLYLRLHEICSKEGDYPLRLAAAQEIGVGGDIAFDELRDAFREDLPEDPNARQLKIEASTATRSDERRYVVLAWLLPMLVGSASTDAEGKPAQPELLKMVGEMLALVGKGMPLSVEAALAQGFKYAANRRPEHPHENAKTRAYLAARAADMLEDADFWFSRLTLLHALALWALSGTMHTQDNGHERHDYKAVVDRWIGREKRPVEHRFVREAAHLVVQALKTKQPERFMWIDESGVATTVGSRPAREAAGPMRRLWIPPSAGWLALDEDAQQLVADVLILLNLAERDDNPADRTRNLKRINGELPHCLTQERCEHLCPTETAGLNQRSAGDRCKSGCPVGLCPYPPKGQQPARVELGEAFCRHQRALLGASRPLPGGKRADWQSAPRSELRRFWSQMEDRART